MKYKFPQKKTYTYSIRTLLILILIILIFQLSHLYHSYQYGWIGTLDFIEYWSAGQLFIEGRNPYNFDDLYNLQLKLGYSNDYPMIMWNPPWLLIWVFPIFFLPFNIAAIFWLLMSLILILCSGIMVWRTLAPKNLHENIIIPVIATITFLPLMFTLILGQISTLILFGIAGFIYFINKNKHFLAGLFLALTMVKPHIVYLLWIAVVFWIITEWDWKLMTGICVVMFPSIVVSSIILPDWLFYYCGAIKNPPLYWTTPTIGTFLRILFFKIWPEVHFAPAILTSLVFIGYLFKRKSKLIWPKIIPALLLVSLPTAAYGWSFDQIVLLVPYLYIIINLFGNEPGIMRKYRFLLALGLVLIEISLLIQRIFTAKISNFFYNLMKLDYFIELIPSLKLSHEVFYFWVPFALGAVYILCCIRLTKT